jgi:hypothetical protein
MGLRSLRRSSVTGRGRRGAGLAVCVVHGGQVKGVGDLHAGPDGRWRGVIELDGTRWAASGVPHAGRLLAKLTIAGDDAETSV